MMNQSGNDVFQSYQQPHKRQRVRSRGNSMDFLLDFDDGSAVADFFGAVPADPLSASFLPLENDDARSSEGLRWDDDANLLSGGTPEKFTVTTPDHLIRMSQVWERMARRGEMCDMELVLPASSSSSTASMVHPNTPNGDTPKIIPLHSVFAIACSSVIANIVTSNEAKPSPSLIPPSGMGHHNVRGVGVNVSKPPINGATGASAGSGHSQSPSANSVSGETEAYDSSTCSSKGSATSVLGPGGVIRSGHTTVTAPGGINGPMTHSSRIKSGGNVKQEPGHSGGNAFLSALNLRVSTRLHLGHPRISIEIPDVRVDEEAATAVRTYMYTGIVNFRPEVMSQILHLALILDMKPLVDLASGYLMSNLSNSYVFDTIQIALQYKLSNLVEAACEYVMRHFDTATQEPGWSHLPLDIIQTVLKSDEVHTHSEIMVFRALVSWAVLDESTRAKLFVDMASDPDYMRLSNMSRDELFEMSRHQLISDSKELRRVLYNEAMQRIQNTGSAPPTSNLPASDKRKISKPRKYISNPSLQTPSRVEESQNLQPLIVNKCERTLTGFGHPVCALAFVAGHLAAASCNSIFIYRVSDWELVTTLHGHSSTVVSLKALPDRLISASPDRTIRVWSADTWEYISVLPTPKSSVCTMIVHEDKLITGSDDGALKSWSLSSWNLLRNVSAHQHVIWALATYGKDTLITGSSDTSIKVWTICRKGGFQAVCTLDGHKDEVQALAVDHSRNWLLSGSDDGCINIHDCKTWTLLRSISWHNRAVLSLVSYGNRIVAGLGNGVVGIWDKDAILQSDEVITSLSEHKSCVMALQVVHGHLITASYDRTIRIWGA